MNATRLAAFDISDLLPQLGRMTVGFDRIFDDLHRNYSITEKAMSYPPYNVIKHSDTEYSIEVAVAGFKEEQLSITQDGNVLIVRGDSTKSEEQTAAVYMHKGISNREFSRSWTLADHVEVKSAEIVNGLLVIHLEHYIPEELKPRQIAISSNSSTKKLK